ncbi:MAG: hypothetical protein NTY22_03470 [Proteobacteria bacterium]|nr:hypothetical protein [Pseudomonadota bacterium]
MNIYLHIKKSLFIFFIITIFGSTILSAQSSVATDNVKKIFTKENIDDLYNKITYLRQQYFSCKKEIKDNLIGVEFGAGEAATGFGLFWLAGRSGGMTAYVVGTLGTIFIISGTAITIVEAIFLAAKYKDNYDISHTVDDNNFTTLITSDTPPDKFMIKILVTQSPRLSDIINSVYTKIHEENSKPQY